MAAVTLAILMTGAGFVLLYAGGEALILGAVKLGQRVGMSPPVIGLTVVAFGTSAPELAVSIEEAFFGHDDVAVANVIGSNITNIALILGLAAMIRVVPVHAQLVRRDIPIMLVCMITAVFMLLDGVLSRFEGLALMAGLVAYLALCLMRPGTTDQIDDPIGKRSAVWLERHRWLPMAVISLGVTSLALGSGLLIEGATWLARDLGISEAVIGLTIVAMGTSLPEFTASIVATIRGHTDIAIANVVGSNIFNVLLVLGITAGLTPLSSSGVSLSVMLIMIALSVLLWEFAHSGNVLSRTEGGVLLGGYLSFNVWILST